MRSRISSRLSASRELEVARLGATKHRLKIGWDVWTMETRADAPPVTEVAAIMRVTPRTIQRWIEKCLFPQPIKPNAGKPVFRRADVELFIASGSIHTYRQAKRGA